MNRIFVAIFFLFIVLGNVPRLLPLPGIPSQVNALEAVLYVCSLFLFLRYFRIVLFRNYLAITLLLLVTTSFAYGCIISGWDSGSFLYAIRLVLQVLTGVVCGYCLFCSYSLSAEKLISDVVYAYALLAVISLGILMIIPDSTMLWAFLGDGGIEFEGDPHVGRLVSTYFDPNFYGSIVVMPLTLGLVHERLNGASSKFRMALGVIFVSLILTYSRSGLSAFLLVCASFVLVPGIRTKFLSLRTLVGLLVLIFALLLVGGWLASLIDISITDRIYEKFFGVTDDPSALGRLESLSTGFALISQHPWFGIGYNYGLQESIQVRGAGLDSSLQVLLLNFGILGAFLAGLSILISMVLMISRIRNRSSFSTRALFFTAMSNIFVAVLWSGNFNQILFYQFWIIPSLAVFFYFYFVSWRGLSDKSV
ncbi:O-antigen ligase family protein [Niveibacterium terrae]|uniref:O-antigen ligase family protein n=1 Tax=Niveibacterium terrae TaxID=3373598 RepID=UPI003A933778